MVTKRGLFSYETVISAGHDIVPMGAQHACLAPPVGISLNSTLNVQAQYACEVLASGSRSGQMRHLGHSKTCGEFQSC